MCGLSTVLAFESSNGGEPFLVMFLFLLFLAGMVPRILSKLLPPLARALGQSVREFKKAANDVERNFKDNLRGPPRPPPGGPPGMGFSTPAAGPPAKPAKAARVLHPPVMFR